MYIKLAEIVREDVEELDYEQIADVLNDEFGFDDGMFAPVYTPESVENEIIAGFIEIGDDEIVVWIDGV